MIACPGPRLAFFTRTQHDRRVVVTGAGHADPEAEIPMEAIPVSLFELEALRVYGTWTLVVKGEVDSSTAPQLREAIRRGVGLRHVIIDLRSVPFVDSAGLGALVCGVREIRASNGVAALCIGRGPVKRLLNMTGFDRIVPTASSLEEAHALLLEPEDQALVAR